MTRPRRAALLGACLALCLGALPAQAEPDARAAALQTADAQWNSLRLHSDADGLARLLSERWILTHSDGKVQHKADYLAQLRTGSRRNTAITNEDVTVAMHGDTAVVTGKSVQSGVGEQGPFSGAFRFTRVWLWQDGRWLMLASHSSRLQ